MGSTSVLSNEVALRRACESSDSISEVLKRLKLSVAGGNFKSLKKYCKDFGIPIPVWVRTGPVVVRPIDEIFCENSTYKNRDRIKSYLLKFGVPEVCSDCGCGSEWNGKRLVLQLDHINGVSNDHRRENLRLLCPNCHSQTATFCGRHKSASMQRCLDCGTPDKSKKSKRCKKCHNKILAEYSRSQSTKIVWPKKSVLERLVKKSNYSAVARDLGVTDNAVRKRLNSIHE